MDTPTPPKKARWTLGKKAASLLEGGMLIGLIAVSAIGAVFATGDSARVVFCEAQSAIERSMGWGEGTCVSETDGDGDGGGGAPDGGGGGQGGGGELPPPTVDYSGLALTNANYPARTTGVRGEFTALPVAHGGGQTLEMEGATGADIAVCYQTDPLQAAVCGETLTIPANAVTIGWQATLPTDVRATFVRSFTAHLTAADNTALRQWVGLTVQRAQAANWLNLSTDFPAIVYPEATSGTQTHMQPLAGLTTPTLTLSTLAGEPIAPCWQATSAGAVTCGAVSSATTVPGDAYAIGFRGNDLPVDPRVAFSTTNTLRLASTLEPGNPIEWAISRTRAATAIALTWAPLSPNTVTLPVGTLTETYVSFPVTGTFNGPMRLAMLTAPAANTLLCYEAGGAPVCSPRGTAWGSQQHTVPANITAIGVLVQAAALPANIRTPWSSTAQVRLQSTLDGTTQTVQTITVVREAEEPVFAPTFSVANSTWQTYHPVASGVVTHMVPMTGTFNDPITLRTTAGGTSNLQTCKQATMGGAISCTATGSISVAPTDYAIGMRYSGFPGGGATNNYANSNQPTFRLESTNDSSQFVSFTPRMERLPLTVPASILNIAVNRVRTSGGNETGNLTNFFRNGVGEQARLTILSNNSTTRLAMCTYSSGGSTSLNIMCPSFITNAGQTATVTVAGTGRRIWIESDSWGPTGTAKTITFLLEVWNTADPTATLRSYTMSMARPS